MSFPKQNAGFTMVEIIVVSVIMGILAFSVAYVVPNYSRMRRDNQRKVDLKNLKIALEDYIGDKVCYPPESVIQSCDSDELQPYMVRVPCDPQTGEAYQYSRSSDCFSYQLYANLESSNDQAIEQVGCENGCGPGGAYNYGVSGGNESLEKQ